MNTTKEKTKPPFSLRTDSDVWQAVQQNSKENHRSLNAEINFRLRLAYGLKAVEQEAA